MPAALATLGTILATLSSVFGAATLPPRPANDPAQLASALNLAQATIDAPTSTPADVAAAGRFEQMAADQLFASSAAERRATFRLLDRPRRDAPLRALNRSVVPSDTSPGGNRDDRPDIWP